LGIALITLRVGGLHHIVGKLSIRATTFLQTSSQLEVYTQSYGPLKLQKSQLWEFRDSHLGVLRQNDIWVLVMWPCIEYTIKGKVVAQVWAVVSLVSSWLIHASRCSNYALTNLLFSLCKFVWVIELLVNLPNPIPELQDALLPPKCCEPRSEPQLLFLSMSSPLGS